MASNTTFDFTPKSSSSMIPGLDVSYPSLPLSLLLVFLVCSFQSATLNSEKASTVNTPIREIADVNAATDGVGINFAVDCISEGTSTGNISQCFMEAERQAVGGVKRVVVAGKAAWVAAAVRKDVVPLYSVVWCSLGHELTYNDAVIPVDLAHRPFAMAFYRYLSSFAHAFTIKSNPVRLMPGGHAFSLFVSLDPGRWVIGRNMMKEWMCT